MKVIKNDQPHFDYEIIVLVLPILLFCTFSAYLWSRRAVYFSYFSKDEKES